MCGRQGRRDLANDAEIIWVQHNHSHSVSPRSRFIGIYCGVVCHELRHRLLCCAVLCYVVLCCVVLCCVVLCCVVLCCVVLCCVVLCCVVLCCVLVLRVPEGESQTVVNDYSCGIDLGPCKVKVCNIKLEARIDKIRLQQIKSNCTKMDNHAPRRAKMDPTPKC